MDIETIRRFCLSFPYATEDIQWGNNLLFRVGLKMFAIVDMDSAPNRLSVKSTPEESSELVEMEGIIPAPYLARYHWVTLERFDVLPSSEVERLIESSYHLVFAKLPKRVMAQLTQAEKGIQHVRTKATRSRG